MRSARGKKEVRRMRKVLRKLVLRSDSGSRGATLGFSTARMMTYST
jgi:hypothetical protein